jgi:hypothetical protein
LLNEKLTRIACRKVVCFFSFAVKNVRLVELASTVTNNALNQQSAVAASTSASSSSSIARQAKADDVNSGENKSALASLKRVMERFQMFCRFVLLLL